MDISLKIYGPMIPSFDPDLATRVMPYFDAEAAACDVLARLEGDAFLRLDAARKAQWLLMTERVLDSANAASAAARERLAELCGLQPPGLVAQALRSAAAGSPAPPPTSHLIGQMISDVRMTLDIAGAPAARQENPDGGA